MFKKVELTFSTPLIFYRLSGLLVLSIPVSIFVFVFVLSGRGFGLVPFPWIFGLSVPVARIFGFAIAVTRILRFSTIPGISRLVTITRHDIAKAFIVFTH